MRTLTHGPTVSPAADRLQKPPRKRPFSTYRYGVRPLNEAGQKRVESHTWLAYQLARNFARYHARGVPTDELIAEGLYGLTYASSLFKEELGVPFGAYARMVIRHRLIQSVMRWRRGTRCCQFPLMPTPTGTIEWETEAPPGPDVVAEAAAREMRDHARRVLPARLYHVLRLRYGEGRTLQEIGTRLGVTRQRARQLIVQAGSQLRECFPEWSRF